MRAIARYLRVSLAARSLAACFAAAEPTRFFNVRDFGARGDGAADDRPALQAALDAAAASGSPATVCLEAGRVYRLGTNAQSVASLSLIGATNLTLEGAGATLLAHPAGRILTVFKSTGITLLGEGTGEAAIHVKTRASAEAQTAAACLACIRACQLSDGAFAQVAPSGSGSPVWIAPYFANVAALALLAGHAREPSPEDVARVGRWLDWCAKHQAADGCWNDFEGTAASYRDTGKVDAWDSSAALFLLAADRYRCAGGTITPEFLTAAQRALACLAKVMDADGLTWAKPDYRMKYLMDNVEVRAGLAAAAALFAAAGQAEVAEQAAGQAGRIGQRLSDFWRPAEGCFAYVLQADGTFKGGLVKPYPHRLAQLYGIAFVAARPEAWARIGGAYEPDDSPAGACGAAWWLAAAARLEAPDRLSWRDRAVAEAAAFSPQRTYLNRYALSVLALLEGAEWLCGPAGDAEKEGQP